MPRPTWPRPRHSCGGAETEWARIEKLFKQRVVSEKSRGDAQAELEAQKAAVLMAESEVETAQLNFDYTKVTAPISGVTGMEVQSEGSLISATGLFDQHYPA